MHSWSCIRMGLVTTPRISIRTFTIGHIMDTNIILYMPAYVCSQLLVIGGEVPCPTACVSKMAAEESVHALGRIGES